MEDDLYPWVRAAWEEPFEKADVLFRSVSASEGNRSEWRMNARMANAGEYAYMEGYRLAGRVVANYLLQEDHWETDLLVYPIVFLYRHCIELHFKKIIPDGAFLADRTITEAEWAVLRGKHRLDLLWEILKPILQDHVIGVDADRIEAIESYVTQLHEIDKESFSFRYSITKSGAPSIDKNKLPHVNIGVLAGCMEKLTAYLDGISGYLSEAVQAKCEMEADARAEYESSLEHYEDGSYDGW